MSAVEMEIRLVDGSPQEQAAFDQPPQEFANTVERLSLEVASLQRQLNAKTAPTTAQGGSKSPSSGGESPASDDYRDLRQSMVDLTRQFSPKFLADPLVKLIESFAPKATDRKTDRTVDQSNASPAGPTVGSTVENVAIAANQVIINGQAKTEQSDAPTVSMPSEPKTEPKSSGRFAEFQKSVVRKIESTRFGKAAMRAARGVRSTVRSAGRAIGRTRFGKAVTSVGRRVAGSSFGKAIAGTAGRALGSGATATAAGTGAVAAGTAGTAVASVAAPVAVAVTAIGGLAVAAKLGGDALLSMAGDLSELSGSLAYSKARGQMNTELNMIDRAQKVGPGLGQIANANNRLNDASEKLLTQMLVLLTRFAPAIEVGADTLTAIVAAADVVLKGIDRLITLATPNLDDNQPAIDALNASLDKLQKSFGDIFKNNDDDEHDKALQREFENFLKLDEPKKKEDD